MEDQEPSTTNSENVASKKAAIGFWKIKDEFAEYVRDSYNQYCSKINKQDTNIIGEEMIYDIEKIIVSILCNLEADSMLDDFYLECSFLPNSDSFAINYNKKQKRFSKMSVLINLSVDPEPVPIILTNIDTDAYKFKDYKYNNLFNVAYLKPYSIIQHDNDKYFVWFNNPSNPNDFYDVLKITLWSTPLNIINRTPGGRPVQCSRATLLVNELYQAPLFEGRPDSNLHGCKQDNASLSIDESSQENLTKRMLQENIEYIEKYMGKYVEDDLYESGIFDEIFYKKTNRNLENLVGVIKKNKDCADYMELMVSTQKNIVSLNYLKNKYGLLAEEIYPFTKINMDINADNRFYRQKLYKNILSKDVCYWIINEYEKTILKHANEKIKTMLNIDYIPGVLNFLFFISNLWFEEIKAEFGINQLRLNLTDIYVNKYNNNNNYINSIKDSFLCLNICLSTPNTYSGGEFGFYNNMMVPYYNDDIINFEQGDMLLHNNKKKIKLMPIKNGNVYFLTLVSEIIY